MDFLFFLFASLALISGLMVISSRNPVHSVFFLILVFCFSSCLLLMLTIDFLAIIFIVVYVGAIAVLFLFVVMMLNIKLAELTESFVRYVPLALLVGFLFLLEISYSVSDRLSISSVEDNFIWGNLLLGSEGISLFGEYLYTHYIIAFIISGMILLVSMIGTINLTLYHSYDIRRQAVYKQLGRELKTAVVLAK